MSINSKADLTNETTERYFDRQNIHLYPRSDAKGRLSLLTKGYGWNLAQTRKAFEAGRTFYDGHGNPLSIYDIPPGRIVKLHCNKGATVLLQVVEEESPEVPTYHT